MTTLFSNEGTLETSEDSDYTLEREVGGIKLMYNPLVYNGQNIGQFVNQGGLLEGLTDMIQQCDVDMGSTGLRIGHVTTTLAEHTNVVYTGRGYSKLHIKS